MKISLIKVILAIFLFYSCNDIQRKSSGNWNYVKGPESNIRDNNNKIPETVDLTEEEKEIAKLEIILKTDFKLSFKGVWHSGNRWGYKIQVPKSINKKYLLRVLDDFGERGERLIQKIGNAPEDLKYKGELEIKVEAVKYFMDNHDRDESLFVKLPKIPPPQPKPQPPKEEEGDEEEPGYCTSLAGIYWETGKEYKGERIEIIKVDCLNFKLKLNNQKHKYNLPFSKNFKCSTIGSYAICTKGIKIDNNLINFFINEKWLDSGCSLKKNITIDIGRGILNSGVTYRCSDRTKNYSKLIEYQLTAE